MTHYWFEVGIAGITYWRACVRPGCDHAQERYGPEWPWREPEARK